MSAASWPPQAALWTIVAASLAGVAVAFVVGAPPFGIALPLALALGTSAVALDRRQDGGSIAGASDARRPAPAEADQVREVVERRPVLLRATLTVAALAGVGTVGWLWRFAPRRPPGTGWRDGIRAIDGDGRPVRPDDLPPGSIITVWPQGHLDEELAAVVVLRLPAPAPAPGTELGAVLAYSRICTHAGCSVALFRAEAATLYCPCHQATFDAREGARPVFGPASRPLPSLPLGIDDEGFLVARGDLSAPPGPEMGGRR